MVCLRETQGCHGSSSSWWVERLCILTLIIHLGGRFDDKVETTQIYHQACLSILSMSGRTITAYLAFLKV